MRKFQCLIMAVIAMTASSWVQRTISGKVADDKGVAVPNVSMQAKGTQTGTVSGADGSFPLTVPSNARTLVFSYAGMATQEVNIGNQTSFSVSFEKVADANLQEIVVVGYGTQRESDVTGNIATVKGSAIAGKPVTSFDGALGGRAAGVQITVPNGVLNNPPVFPH